MRSPYKKTEVCPREWKTNEHPTVEGISSKAKFTRTARVREEQFVKCFASSARKRIGSLLPSGYRLYLRGSRIPLEPRSLTRKLSALTT